MTARRVQLVDLAALGSALPVGPGAAWDNPWRVFEWPQWSRSRPWAVGLTAPGVRDVYGTCASEHAAAEQGAGLYLGWLAGDVQPGDRWPDLADLREDILADIGLLAGRDLACPCPVGWPCHADHLVRIAAGESPRMLLDELVGRRAA